MIPQSPSPIWLSTDSLILLGIHKQSVRVTAISLSSAPGIQRYSAFEHGSSTTTIAQAYIPPLFSTIFAKKYAAAVRLKKHTLYTKELIRILVQGCQT